MLVPDSASLVSIISLRHQLCPLIPSTQTITQEETKNFEILNIDQASAKFYHIALAQSLYK